MKKTKVNAKKRFTFLLAMCLSVSSLVAVFPQNKVMAATASVTDFESDEEAQQLVSEFIEKNITEEMSTYEKVEEVLKFIEYETEYDATKANGATLIVDKIGNCEAASEAVQYICDQLEIPCATRTATLDCAFDGGHVNNVISVDGTSYIADVLPGHGYEGFGQYAGQYIYGYTFETAEEYFGWSNNNGDYVFGSGNYAFTYDDDGNAVVYECFDFGDEDGTITFPETAVHNGRTYSVVDIQAWEFPNADVTKVVFPDSFTSINGNFWKLGNLETVVLGENVTTIGSNAFNYYNSTNPLKEINLSNVTTIESKAFYNCPSLTDVDLSSVTTIGEYAFYNCDSLTSLDLSSATSIEKRAFYYCDLITDVNLSSIEELGEGSFAVCRSLKSVTLNESLTEISSGCFSSCSSLTDINLDNITTYGDGAFSSCGFTGTLEIKKGITYGSDVFAGNGYTSISLYEGITELTDGLLAGLSEVETFTIPDTVTTIGEYCFRGETNLTLVIPDSVTNIAENAFNVVKLVYCDSDSYAAQYCEENGITWLDPATEYSVETSTVTCSATTFTYTGRAITPTITSVYWTPNSSTSFKLTEGTDYEVEYEDNINVGDEAKVIIKGINDYTGEKVIYFTIIHRKLWASSLYSGSSTITSYAYFQLNGYTLNTCSMTYTGSEVCPTVKLLDTYYSSATGTTTLQKDTDYTVTYSDNVNVGTATVTVEGIGNFYGTVSRTFTINAKSISGVTITPEKDSYTYTGSAITPNITVTDGDMTLVEGTDYTVECSNNTAIGTATVTITGMGNYTGTASTTFSIVACSHDNLTSTVTKEATCTTAGTIKYTCPDCGETYTETVAATGHTYDSGTVTKEATCTSAGTKTYTCTTCGATKTESIAATGHSYTSKVTTAATCGSTGVRTYTCSDCGYSYTATIAATGNHTYTSKVTTAATCTTAGTRTYTCSVCGDTYTTSIAATGHTYNSGTVTKEATCTSAGTKTYTCTTCGATKTETIAATGHSYTTKTVAATYAAQGYTLHTCSNCGATYKDNYTAKKTVPATTASTSFTPTASSVKISWTKVSVASGYQVQRYNSSTSSWSTVKTITSGSTTSYTNSSLSGGTTYKYRVRAYVTYNGTKYYGSYSSTITTTTKPSKVTASSSYTKTTSAITIKWTKVSGASGYQVQRYNSSSKSWSTVKTITSGSTVSYKNTGLSSGTTYKYRVRAYTTLNGTKYYGSYSSTITTSTKPAKVTISSTSKSKTAIKLTWKKVTGASGYEVQRYNSSTKKWVTVKTIKSGSTVSYKNTGLKKGTTYKYRIRAYRTVNGTKLYGAWSSTKKVTTKS